MSNSERWLHHTDIFNTRTPVIYLTEEDFDNFFDNLPETPKTAFQLFSHEIKVTLNTPLTHHTHNSTHHSN